MLFQDRSAIPPPVPYKPGAIKLLQFFRFDQFHYQICTILYAVQKYLSLIGTAQAAAEVKHCIVILQGQGM